MTDARMVATNTHRRWRAVQSAAPRADRMTCSSHGLALGLIKPASSRYKACTRAWPNDAISVDAFVQHWTLLMLGHYQLAVFSPPGSRLPTHGRRLRDR